MPDHPPSIYPVLRLAADRVEEKDIPRELKEHVRYCIAKHLARIKLVRGKYLFVLEKKGRLLCQ